jgi:hypothetical protein
MTYVSDPVDGDIYVAGGQRRKYFLMSGMSSFYRAYLQIVDTGAHNPTDVTGDDGNSAGVDRTSDDIIWYSGEFSEIVKSSVFIGGAPEWRSNPNGLTCDETNTGTSGISQMKLTTWSGKVSSFVKTSYYVGAPGAHGVAWDIADTMYNQYTMMYHLSGKYSSFMKSTLSPVPYETQMGGITWDLTDILTAGEGTGDLLQRWSGRFTSTIKFSFDFSIQDGNPRGIDVWNMADGRMQPTQFPNIDVSPSTVDFEDTFISTTEEKTVTITNIGTAFLTVTAVATTSTYYTVAGLSTYVASGLVKAFSLPPAGSTIFTVIYEPVTTDVETGFVSIANDAPGETLVSVFLTGYGSNLPPLEGTQNFTLYIDQQRIQDRYISQGRSFTGYVEQARNFDLEL